MDNLFFSVELIYLIPVKRSILGALWLLSVHGNSETWWRVHVAFRCCQRKLNGKRKRSKIAQEQSRENAHVAVKCSLSAFYYHAMILDEYYRCINVFFAFYCRYILLGNLITVGPHINHLDSEGDIFIIYYLCLSKWSAGCSRNFSSWVKTKQKFVLISFPISQKTISKINNSMPSQLDYCIGIYCIQGLKPNDLTPSGGTQVLYYKKKWAGQDVYVSNTVICKAVRQMKWRIKENIWLRDVVG